MIGEKIGRLVVFCAVSVFLFGCSFPRIIIMEDPLTPEEHIRLGTAYGQKKEYALAVREFEAAAKKDQSARLYLADALFLNDEPDKAESLYRKVLRDEPNNAGACNNLAWLLYTRKKNLPEARDLALKAVALNPREKEYRDTLEKIEAAIRSEAP